MKISTMTSLFYTRREDGTMTPIPESVIRCKKAGFDTLDLNMCPMDQRRRQLFCDDDWEAKVDEVIKTKEEYGVTFDQSHPPYRAGIGYVFPNDEDNEFFCRMERRALDITARVGGKWAVIHPVWDPEAGPDLEAQLAINHKIYDEMVDMATKLGIGIAFENMVVWPNGPYRFAARPEELVALCDSYNLPNVGICWDFGHGNLVVHDKHEDALRLLGSRLKVTHVHDNLGVKDDHFLPFMGDMPWEKLMPVLKEIGYDGNLNLEMGFNQRMPDCLRDEGAKFTFLATQKLLELVEG